MSGYINMNDPEVIESLKYLLITKEDRIKASTMPFDAKKQCWVPDPKEGYIAAEITATKGDEITVKKSNGDSGTYKKDQIQEMNPPKYDKYEDMSDLTYLNDATILHNLRSRYTAWLIYTYSGLFCVTINPYKRLPVYTMKMVYYYRGKKKNEVPPHLYSIADNAYASMIRDRNNQSMLITGESGAGKTENTKKVIQYFAYVASTGPPKPEGAAKEASLEDQIVSANPVLEAYGNAKTTRNNNSSRFGKFIRIHFGPTGKIAGADIESYLLEKSRITYCMAAERNYHIFYQLLSAGYPRYHKLMMVEPNPKLYYFIAQGMITIDNVDDAKEMKDCDEAFDILNFTQTEKEDLFKLTAVVCHWGNSKWKQRPREEQAEADGTEECEKVAQLLGVDIQELLKGLLKPRIKVGNEFVNKGQNMTQVVNSIGALCKSMYSRAFSWLVVRVNETLDVKTKRQFFIGVLDIAGFEIFEENGFEQLCINYTNERLQQFFNHHMFVVEQEEYKKEGIQWEMMNFGLDLQACIDLIEKPLGIMSILEEECIVPKATDKTFQEKLYSNHLGKHPNFGKPKPQKGKAEAHFDLHHYAGTVSYSVTGWLEKNKDPINTTVATLFKSSKTNALLSLLYQDMGVEEEKGAGGKKGKSGSNQTISSGHREQLSKLMNTLKQTSPHFVRCIIPNEIKTGGVLDPHLVMHQLTCNGVLEGIRICRKGFPNRVYYPDFKHRYAILAPVATKSLDDPIKAAAAILKEVALNEELFRLGLTKVFFKSGVIGQLEDLRDTAISKIMSMLQAHIRVFAMKKQYKVLLEQRLATSVLQRNIKQYLSLRTWPWWIIYCNMKPLLASSSRRAEEEEKARLAAEEEARRIAEEQERLEREKREREEAQARLQKERDDFLAKIQELQAALTKTEQKLAADTTKFENQIKALEEKVAEGDSAQSELVAKRKRLEQESHNLKGELDETQTKLMRAESLVKNHEHEINKLKDLNRQQEELIAKVTREKKRSDEATLATADQLAQEESKVSNLTKIKGKLELDLEETNENLEKERRIKGDLEKVKRRLEGDLKTTLLQVEDLQRFKKDLEESLRRKEGEYNDLTASNEDQQALINTLQKKIKELSQRLDETLNDLDMERQSKAKAEKQRSDLQLELEESQALLDEASDVTAQQAEIKKRLESEIAKLKHDLDESHIHHENALTQLKKKFQEELDEAVEHIDRLEKAKSKFEKDLKFIRSEADEAKLQADGASKARSNLDKTIKTIKKQLQDATTELDELKRVNAELTTSRNSLKAANNTMKVQIEDLESKLNGLNKLKSQMQSQIDAAKQEALEESNAKRKLQEQLSGSGSPTKSKR